MQFHRTYGSWLRQTQCDTVGKVTAVVDTSGHIELVNGTSFSLPIAGAVACLWRALPLKTTPKLCN